MSFDQGLRLTSILLASASFIGLALGASLPEWLVVMTGSVLLLVLLRAWGVQALDRLAGYATLSQATWNAFLLVSFLAFWMDMFWISGDLLPAGVHFLLILMVIKLCNLQNRRDYLHLYAISLMAILASAAMTTDLWYLPVFLAYLLTGVWTLLLFQLTKKTEDSDRPPLPLTAQSGPPVPGRITPQLFWLANGLALGALSLTLVIFFTIPRVSAGLFQKGYGEGLRTSGFSDTVDLGAIGPVKRDPSIVMRVELPDRRVHEVGRFYLRGVAYDRYDGVSWTNQLTHRRALYEVEPLTFAVRQGPLRASAQGRAAVRQNILLEPLDTAVLFAAPFAESITGRFLGVQADPAGALSLSFPSAARIEYSVVSRTNTVLPADLQLQTAAYPEAFARHFLQVPGGSDRVAALAHEITRESRTIFDKALALEKFLSRTYRYSLDIPASEQTHPLNDFLFTRKTGYCEHYATAMVIMLRTLGIPARLVTGFLATEWNEYGNYYLVRQQDAHAWVEVHLPQSGWITMDPTPAVSEAVADPSWRAFGQMMDSLRLRWNRFFVQYSAADQLAMVREIRAGGATVRHRAWDSVTSVLNPFLSRAGELLRYPSEGSFRLFAEFLGLIGAGIGIIGWVLWKRPWRRLFQQPARARQEEAITRLYQTMLQSFARKGLAKPVGTAPLEFLALIRRQWTEAGPLAGTITDLYCRGRFGQTPLSHEDLRLARQTLQQLMILERP